MVCIPKNVLASNLSTESYKECKDTCTHFHDINNDSFEEVVWEDELIVEVESEEEFFEYEKNPNYKYTFIITTSSKARAICYNCGRPNMSTVTTREQYNAQAKVCPTMQWGNDIFSTWKDYTYERCTACSYKSESWESQTTYTATCLNGDAYWNGGDWPVKYEYTQAAGYNLHQSLRWWTQYSQI